LPPSNEDLLDEWPIQRDKGGVNAAERRTAVGAPAEEDSAPGEVANGLARAQPPNFNIVENVNARARTFCGESCYQAR
jgi:hypothetical protein